MHYTLNPQANQQLVGEFANSPGGWSFILSDLKTLLETGQSLTG